MIFSTSFPMFIDSLKSIRLYDWARKKNHRHINTRVCSLKKWNCLVFCYDNPATIDLIWFSCWYFLRTGGPQIRHPSFKNAIRTDFLHSKKPCLVKTFSTSSKVNKTHCRPLRFKFIQMLYEFTNKLLQFQIFFVKTHCTYTLHTYYCYCCT